MIIKLKNWNDSHNNGHTDVRTDVRTDVKYMIKYIRELQKASTHSYVITIPKELVQRFRWKERQKLEIIYDGKSARLTIKDWQKK